MSINIIVTDTLSFLWSIGSQLYHLNDGVLVSVDFYRGRVTNPMSSGLEVVFFFLLNWYSSKNPKESSLLFRDGLGRRRGQRSDWVLHFPWVWSEIQSYLTFKHGSSYGFSMWLILLHQNHLIIIRFLYIIHNSAKKTYCLEILVSILMLT